MFDLLLPVPAYLKKYLITLYGEMMKPTHHDEFGAFILNTLEKKSNHDYTLKSIPNDTTYAVRLNYHIFQNNGCLLSTRKERIIVRALDDKFRNMLFSQAVINKTSFNIPYKETIIAVLKSYGITEDELSYSTIRKDFNRKKTKLIEQMK